MDGSQTICTARAPLSGAKNMGKWGIPGKRCKNVAQQCQLDGCSMFLQNFMAKNRLFDIFTSFSLEHGPFFSTWWPSEENAKKIIFLLKWPVPMLVQNISRGHEILKTFWFFGAP